MELDDRLTATALYRAVLLAFALVVVLLLFPILAGVFLLVLVIAIVAIPLSRAADRLERVHIPRAVGASVVMLLVLGAIGTGISLLVPIFTSEGKRLVDSLPQIVDDVRRSLGSDPPGGGSHGLKDYVSSYTDHPQKLLRPAATVGAGVAGIVTTLVVVVITSLYTAIRPEPLKRGFVQLFPPERRKQVRRIMSELARSYTGWLRGLAVGMLVLGVLTYAGLRVIDLPFALVWATLTAVAMVVPYYGALVSAIPPILFALTISPGKAVLVALIYVIAHQVEGNIIQPLVMAKAVELHPALVAVGVIAGERVFGPVGLMVAVPVLLTARTLVKELWVKRLEPPPAATPPGRVPARSGA
jgi:predicted PurR-regulated permease PerM